jgi:signal transduction histidine kinase/ActR/RegA family two-component response regulator
VGSTIRLRWVVAALVLSIVAPLGALAAIGLQRAWRRQLATVDRQNVATVRAISVAVDQDIENTTAALDVLGELHALDTPDPRAFESLATRLLPYQPNWSALVLAGTDGVIVDAVPAVLRGDPSPDGGARVSGMNWARAVGVSHRPTVSDLFELPGTSGHFLMIAIPVIRDGKVKLALGARVRPDGLGAILREQEAPPIGTLTLSDGNFRIVARTRQAEAYVGTQVSSAFIDIVGKSPEGSWRATSREGVRTYAAFNRSPRTGLTVGLGLPAEEVDGPIRRILWGLAAAWIAVLAFAAALAGLLGRVIVRALTSASHASMALARGDAVSPPPSRIAEIDDLASGLRQAAETLRARNHERDQASRLKDEFLMTVSHELRTPLTAICGWARMLSTGQIRESQRGRALDSIERNAVALQELVNDLLDVSRIVSGKLRLDVQPVALAGVVGAAVETVRPAADAKGIRIATTVALDGAVVVGDAGRLQQVVWNLLSNAVRFTPAGGSIDVAARRDREHVDIAVSDTGTGVEPDFLPYVFDRFRQGASGTTRAHGGLGLGLAIVRHVAELHGGTVRADNNAPLPGATFRVRLPARTDSTAVPADATPVPPATADASTVRGAAQSLRLDHVAILIVDDDLHARELLATILENAGADVRATASAEEALVILDAWTPQALISDVEMAGTDGYLLMRKVRAQPSNHAPLAAIAVTAHASSEDRVRALDAGFHWHLAKPIEPTELLSVVVTLIGQTGGVH